MLIPENPNIYGDLALVSGSTFTDVKVFVIALIGIILAFLIIERLLGIFYPRNSDIIDKRSDL